MGAKSVLSTIRLRDADLRVFEQGHGHPLLLVHGFPLDHTQWNRQFGSLSANCRVIAPDLRGFGQSNGVGEILTMSQIADDLAELLTAMSVHEPVVFCGLSMGGYVAWPFFERHRSRLDRLILCDTRAAADSEQVARGRHYLAERVLNEGPQQASAELLQKLFARKNLERLADDAAAVLAVMNATSPQTIAAALRGMAERPDMSHLLPKIDLPTLVICGVEDQITPADEMQAMAEQIPGATFRLIDQAGHLAPLENPDVVNPAIREFIGA
jgi:pimeloyl-ACP methyl ester carboxylesterase